MGGVNKSSVERRSGYLLAELCWGIALMALVASVTIPFGHHWQETIRSDWVMQELVNAIEETQAVARGNSLVTPILIVSGTPENAWYVVYQSRQLPIRGTLPKGYSFTAGKRLFLTFQKNGRVGTVGYGAERVHRIAVRTPSGRVRTVVISAQTGRVRVEG